MPEQHSQRCADPLSLERRASAAAHHRLSGDTVHFECVDSSGAQVHPGMTVAEFEHIDRGLIHALTGPVAIARRAARRRTPDRRPRSPPQRLGMVQHHPRPRLPQAALRRAIPLPLEARCRHHALARAGSRSAAALLRHHGRRARRAGRVPHAPARRLRRQHGRPRARHRRHALPARAAARRALLLRRRARRPGRRRGLHQRHRVPRRRHRCAFICTSSSRSPARSSNPRLRTNPAPRWLVVESHTDALDRRARRHRPHGRSARSHNWGFAPVHAYLLCSVAMKLQTQPGRQRADDHRLRRDREDRFFPTKAIL